MHSLLLLAFLLILSPLAAVTPIAQKQPAAPAKKQNPSLMENLNSGSYIRLTDNTLWHIRPEDTAITQSWITPTEITVAPSKDHNWPFKLTNSLTKSSVLAQKADKVPLTPSPMKPMPTAPQK